MIYLENHAGANWHKSSRSGSGTGECVEVGSDSEQIGIRDTKQAGLVERTTLVVPRAAFTAFVHDLKMGHFTA